MSSSAIKTFLEKVYGNYQNCQDGITHGGRARLVQAGCYTVQMEKTTQQWDDLEYLVKREIALSGPLGYATHDAPNFLTPAHVVLMDETIVALVEGTLIHPTTGFTAKDNTGGLPGPVIENPRIDGMVELLRQHTASEGGQSA